MALNPKITLRQIAHAAPERAKGAPRGNSNHPAFKARQFKKGQSGNPGGRVKVYTRMASRLAEELAKPAPKEFRKAFKLKPSATQYDICLASMIRCAMAGEWQAMLGIRDVIEGRLPNKNYNLTVEMQAYLDNPGFREFLNQQHQLYLEQGGTFDDQAGATITSIIQRLSGTAGEETEPTD